MQFKLGSKRNVYGDKGAGEEVPIVPIVASFGQSVMTLGVYWDDCNDLVVTVLNDRADVMEEYASGLPIDSNMHPELWYEVDTSKGGAFYGCDMLLREGAAGLIFSNNAAVEDLCTELVLLEFELTTEELLERVEMLEDSGKWVNARTVSLGDKLLIVDSDGVAWLCNRDGEKCAVDAEGFAI